jgi:hypothetical protein
VPRLEIDDLVLDRREYDAQRAQRRKLIVPLRRSRRVQLGDHLALEFENEETLHHQVQEMIYAENISDENGAMEEIDTYKRLLPTSGSVSATMFLEFADVDRVREDLDRLEGIQNSVALRIGGTVVKAVDVPPPDEPDRERTYSVHFLRFDIAPTVQRSLADLMVPAALTVDHPHYRAEIAFPAPLRAQLLDDLIAAA